MITLTDDQVDGIAARIRTEGIRLTGLQDNLLDHICILVEEGLADGGEYALLVESILPSFYTGELYELEEEALFLEKLKGPRLVLSRGRFFLLLFGIVLGPYFYYFVMSALGWLPVAYNAPSMIALRWTCIGCFWPLLSLLVIYFTPAHLDPLVPRHSTVLLGGGSWIRVLPL